MESQFHQQMFKRLYSSVKFSITWLNGDIFTFPVEYYQIIRLIADIFMFSFAGAVEGVLASYCSTTLSHVIHFIDITECKRNFMLNIQKKWVIRNGDTLMD